MKAFNSEEAKQGKPVCTISGHPVRVICYDRKDSRFPIVALISFGGQESVEIYTEQGRLIPSQPTDIDLAMYE